MEIIQDITLLTDLFEKITKKGQDVSLFFKHNDKNSANFNLIGKLSFEDENQQLVGIKVSDPHQILDKSIDQPSLLNGRLSFISDFCKYYFEITPSNIIKNEDKNYTVTTRLPLSGQFRKSRRFIRVSNHLPEDLKPTSAHA